MFVNRFYQNDYDLLNPPAELEKRKHKLKRLVQSPNSFFMDVKCQGCFNITTVFSHSQTVVVRGNCQTVLCQPTGGVPGLQRAAPSEERVDCNPDDMLSRESLVYSMFLDLFMPMASMIVITLNMTKISATIPVELLFFDFSLSKVFTSMYSSTRVVKVFQQVQNLLFFVSLELWVHFLTTRKHGQLATDVVAYIENLATLFWKVNVLALL
ncbi:ribosomal protein S27 [Perilla frutescens var. frutescens]|nr:ribosomal protein S27 [Perilla frutescens var. frutescens]